MATLSSKQITAATISAETITAERLTVPREWSLIVPGQPVPWTGKQSNPKTGNRFVPAKQAAHAGKIIDAWERSGLAGPGLCGHEALELSCVFFVQRPKGHYGTGRNFNVIKPQFVHVRPTGRPDFSNLVKMVEDALTSHAWKDDDQIVGHYEPMGKFYTEALDEQPRTVIRIRLLS